jgi:hypothetical protein
MIQIVAVNVMSESLECPDLTDFHFCRSGKAESQVDGMTTFTLPLGKGFETLDIGSSEIASNSRAGDA